MPRFDLFRRIHWVKSVTMEEDVVAYSPEDTTTKARVPKRPGDRFELHASEDDALTLGDPAVGDVLVLTQNDQITHLVEVTGESVEPRPRATIRKGTRDARFTMQREVQLIVLHDFATAPLIDQAFGFDPQAKGGEVLRIEDLPRFRRSGEPLWLVQRRIMHAMTAPPKLTVTLPPRAAPLQAPPWEENRLRRRRFGAAKQGSSKR